MPADGLAGLVLRMLMMQLSLDKAGCCGTFSFRVVDLVSRPASACLIPCRYLELREMCDRCAFVLAPQCGIVVGDCKSVRLYSIFHAPVRERK
jgi:hypothetical protein